MAKQIWVIEINLESVNPFEYRITTVEQMLKMNVARTFCKVNDLSAAWKESNWIAIGMAHSEEEANQKAERLKPMVLSEREHALATGESLHLSLWRDTMESCKQSGNEPQNHFTGTGKMVEIGSQTAREVNDYHRKRQ